MPWTKDAGWVRWGSQSNPELGKNGNPLIGYAPRHPIPVSISEDEQEAEQLYYSLAAPRSQNTLSRVVLRILHDDRKTPALT